MSNQHKKSTTKLRDTPSGLTEERVREIAREEISKYLIERASRRLPL